MATPKALRATLVAVSAASLTLLSTPLVVAQPATPVVGQDRVTADPDFPTMPQTAGLVITKLTPSSHPEANDGRHLIVEAPANNPQRQLPDSKPIEGVTFTAYKVEGLDISTNEGWNDAFAASKEFEKLTTAQKEAATSIASGTAGKSYTISTTPVEIGTTNAQGRAIKMNIPRGFYLVKETIKGNVTIDGKQYPAAKVTKAAPFVIALPLTDPVQRNRWQSPVFVYPKNSVTDVEKSVEDVNATAAGTGSHIEYKVAAKVTPNTQYSNFQLVDPVDARIDVTKAQVDLVIKKAGQKVNTFTKGTDYEIVTTVANPMPTSTNDDPKAGTLVSAKFTDAGLKKLKDSGVDEVSLVIPGSVKNLTGKNEIHNTGYLFPNKPYTETDKVPPKPELPTPPTPPTPPTTPGQPPTPPEIPPYIPTNPVVSKYGKVKIYKVETGNHNKKLAGVKFQITECNGTDPAAAIKAAETAPILHPNGQREFTTNDKGEVEIDGLQLNDFKNNSANEETGSHPEWKASRFYCLREIETAKDHSLLPNPIRFQLTQNDSDFTKELTVENPPSNSGFHIPLTGGKGVGPLVGLGGLLVVGAAGYAAVAARRKREQA